MPWHQTAWGGRSARAWPANHTNPPGAHFAARTFLVLPTGCRGHSPTGAGSRAWSIAPAHAIASAPRHRLVAQQKLDTTRYRPTWQGPYREHPCAESSRPELSNQLVSSSHRSGLPDPSTARAVLRWFLSPRTSWSTPHPG